MKRTVAILAVLLVAAVYAGPASGFVIPRYRVTLKLSAPRSGSCSSATTAAWRRVPQNVTEVDFFWSFNGGSFIDEDRETVTPASRGSVTATAPPSVAAGESLQALANFKSGGTILRVEDSKTLTC